MKAPRTLFIIIAFILIILIVKFLFFPGNKKSGGGNRPEGKPLAVSGIVVEQEKLEQVINSTGTLYAFEEAELRSETSGRITGIYFKEGETVQKGELLIKINDADLKAELNKLLSRKELVQTRLSRLNKLIEVGGISQEELETAETEFSALQSDIAYTKAMIDKTEIHAPFSGRIGLKNISEGNFVNSSNLIATIQQLDPVKLDFFIPEKYLNYLNKGDTVSFNTANSDKSHKAIIAAREPMIDPTTRSGKIRAYASNSDRTLIPGSFVNVSITISTSPKALLIPSESIVPVLKGKKVYVVRNGKVDEAMVKTGERLEERVEILEGLAPGDSVLTTGILQVRKGSPVNFSSIN